MVVSKITTIDDSPHDSRFPTLRSEGRTNPQVDRRRHVSSDLTEDRRELGGCCDEEEAPTLFDQFALLDSPVQGYDEGMLERQKATIDTHTPLKSLSTSVLKFPSLSITT
ncbi:hypothetical protein BJ508DRAFT_378114 [Ascobolus immersus RN42]|uniref:Uncharacterized protein n=1 Tax=Ascobolus immersus RN42 TaxID=1160509 RepID=A0A3N4HY43_ASCIM|nr:hypothetical protein BJ508DRAFT_378114 [Ascobolus immersus RN42]